MRKLSPLMQILYKLMKELIVPGIYEFIYDISIVGTTFYNDIQNSGIFRRMKISRINHKKTRTGSEPWSKSDF